ncbi:hypothetical protein GGF46_004799 [Coemansia sp. RSA 552]|nr:hypothetical protein GGF46_004799 [Coemansia sp. RSA 552]
MSNLFSCAIIEITIDLAERVSSKSNIAKISTARMENQVKSVIVSIPINAGSARGYSLYKAVLPEINRQCGVDHVRRNQSTRYKSQLTSDVAATIEAILVKFPNAKSILLEVPPPPESNRTRFSKVFSYVVRDSYFFANVYVECCWCRCAAVYGDIDYVHNLNVSLLNELNERDCSYEAVVPPKYSRRLPDSNNERYRYLLYYPVMWIRRATEVSQFGLFQVIP